MNDHLRAWRRSTRLLFVAALLLVAGCASLPPGADYPKTATNAFSQPLTTRLGKQVAVQAERHAGQSGFRLLPHGVDGLLMRAQLVRAAERSIDIQYYIFAEDDTGKLLQESILRAADRGVRVRMLIDDTNSFGRSGTQNTLGALNDHKNIELRMFNPFFYRGDLRPLRYVDIALNAPRVNHRMHNKLLVVDNAMAIVGGRNVADEYYGSGAPPATFTMFPAAAPPVRFGDFDVAATGPIVPQLSATFDDYWNCSLSIPQKALGPIEAANTASLPEARAALSMHAGDRDIKEIERRVKAGDPLAGVLSGRLPMVWAKAAVIVDPPEKAEIAPGEPAHSPIARALVQGIRNAKHDLVIVTPYFVPGSRIHGRLDEALQRGVRVRILTNSLSSTDVPAVHSAYSGYRKPLLEAGAELYEIRAVPGQLPTGSGLRGSGLRGSGSGGGDRDEDASFALHAKLYVYDGERVFIGSANFDRRSFRLNTELGLMIDSPELARQIVARFDQFASSSNSYRLVLDHGAFGPRVLWRTRENGRMVDLDDDPDTTAWRRAQVTLYRLLPINELL